MKHRLKLCVTPQRGAWFCRQARIHASLNRQYYFAYLMQLWLVLLCVVTLLGRKRGHWLTKHAANEDPAWQQERPPEIPQNLGLPV